MSLVENYRNVKSEINNKAKLVAVSKTKPKEDILALYKDGHRSFGENKVQELIDKHNELPKDIEWHMIGHLQTNKVKLIVPFITLIHGVDSLKLLKEINKRAKNIDRVVPCLLQIHIAQEDTKFGLDQTECLAIMNDISNFENIRIKGLMGMATNTPDKLIIEREFQSLNKYYHELLKSYPYAAENFEYLSIGMSSDYKLAIECGGNLVRVGSSIFGSRNN